MWTCVHPLPAIPSSSPSTLLSFPPSSLPPTHNHNKTRLDRVVCESVMNGKQAVDLCAHRHFDVILMDLFMPVMNGLDATREINNIYRYASFLPSCPSLFPSCPLHSRTLYAFIFL